MLKNLRIDSPDECETATLAGEPIARYIYIADFAASLENPTEILRRRSVSQIVDFQRHHAVDPGRWPAVAHPDAL